MLFFFRFDSCIRQKWSFAFPDEWADKAIKDERTKVINMVIRKIKERTKPLDEDGWALRALKQREYSIACFPKHVWLEIYKHCDFESRIIVLPRVCRFFRHLLPAQDRVVCVLEHFSIGYNEPWNRDPTFMYVLAKKNHKVNPKYASALMYNSKAILTSKSLTDLILRFNIVEKEPLKLAYQQSSITLKYGDYTELSFENESSRVMFKGERSRIGRSCGGSEMINKVEDTLPIIWEVLGIQIRPYRGWLCNTLGNLFIIFRFW